MVNFISSWLRDIVVLFIIIFISELIMPKGNMKRYIDLIIGILIIIAIINPFAKLMNYDINIKGIIDNYDKSKEFSVNMEDDFANDQQEQIEKLFKDKFENQIIHLVEENWEYEVLRVDIELEETGGDYENIKSVQIFIDKNREEDIRNKEDIVSIEKIPKVEIKQKQGEEDSKVSINEPKDYKEIKKLIGKKFSIDMEKIKIQ